MIWFTWRQIRTQTVVAAAGLAVFGVVLLITGRILADLYSEAGACTSDCAELMSTFLNRFQDSVAFPVGYVAIGLAYVVPALLGLFWGAPLFARELENGTHRLAWNQSVTRGRWFATKLGTGLAVVVLGSGLLSWATTVWFAPVITASHDGMLPLTFGARGIVPVGYAVFAFVVGVTAGMLLRRVVPAMAVTLAVYVAAVGVMPLWLRARLAPASHDLIALGPDSIQGISISKESRRIDIFGAEREGTWTVSNHIVTSDGTKFTGPADLTKCGPEGTPDKCNAWLASLNLKQDILFHPASHFWPLQWAETGLFVGLAALLAAFCFWWTRHRIV